MKRILIILAIGLMLTDAWALDVVFRYDDYRLMPDTLQEQMIEVFAEEQVPLHIAVIPYNYDTTPCLQEGNHLERVKELEREGILQIALHGFCHVGRVYDDAGHLSEFMSLTETEQQYRLEKGSRLLDSVFNRHVHIFIPPWNSYNQTTLDILADLGYTVISAAMIDNLIIEDERFQYYPETVDHPAKLAKIIARNAKRDGLVVCMFHPYDFSESFTMEDLRRVLQSVKANLDVHIVTMDALYGQDQSYNAARIQANLHRPLLTKIVDTRSVLLSHAEANRLRVWDLMIHLMIVVVIALIGWIFVKRTDRRYWMMQGGVLLLAGLQTWNLWLMPKVGLVVIVLLALSGVVYGVKIKVKSEE